MGMNGYLMRKVCTDMDMDVGSHFLTLSTFPLLLIVHLIRHINFLTLRVRSPVHASELTNHYHII